MDSATRGTTSDETRLVTSTLAARLTACHWAPRVRRRFFFAVTPTFAFIFFAVLVEIINLLILTFLEPVLSLRLKEFNVSESLTALFFAIPTICYVLIAPFMHKVAKKLENMFTLQFGLFVIALSFLFIGPTWMLGFSDSLVWLTLGLVVLGACYAFTVIPIMPEMIEAAGPQYNGRESELNDRLSSIFNTSVGSG